MTEEDLMLFAQEERTSRSHVKRLRNPELRGKVNYLDGRVTSGKPKRSTTPDLYLPGGRARGGDPRLAPISLEAKNYYFGDTEAYERFMAETLDQAGRRAAALPVTAPTAPRDRFARATGAHRVHRHSASRPRRAFGRPAEA